MKKIAFFIFYLFFISSISTTLAADDIHLKALQDFNSKKPIETFKVEVIEDGNINGLFLIKGDILNCTLQKTKNPTRAKRDARIYFNIVSYEDNKGVHKIREDLTGRYSKTVMNKEKLKEISPKQVIKTTAGAVGDYFFQGVSYGISFVDGLITNDEGNRLKSGVKQIYDDSILSYIEYGEEVEIKEGDTFYFVVTKTKEKDIGKVQNCDEKDEVIMETL